MLFRKTSLYDRPITQIKPRRSKNLRIFFWILALIVVGVVSWIGVTGIVAFNNITDKNDSDDPSFFKFGDEVNPDNLKEGETRINVLLIGLADQGGTDTIQIASIDPFNKQMSLLSVPRDLHVKSPLGGNSRINAVYGEGITKCNQTRVCDKSVNAGAAALKSTLREVLGTDIHYYAFVDFEGFKDVVDAIGGVSIYVEKALSDPDYPCDNDPLKICGYSQKAGTVTMSGTQALKYARCRGGTCGSDFGRSQRQQQVIEAIRQKTLSLGVLSNPKKITDLMTALGNHFKTDMKLDEMLKTFELVQAVDKTKTVTATLDTSAEGPLKVLSSNPYLITPKAGQNDWSGVHDFVLSAMPEPYVIKEAAKVLIVDASGKKSAAALEKKLTALGYNIVGSETATIVQTATSLWGNKDMKYTLALLKKRFSANLTNNKPTATSIQPADIILVIGSNYSTK